MGLFEKKFCAACGNEKGLFGKKLKDGNHLCKKCSSKWVYQFNGSVNIKIKRKCSSLTLDEYNEFVEMRERNLEELQEFSRTKSLCGIMQIDEDAQEIVFIDNATFSKTEKLYEKNPPVFKAENLVLSELTYSASTEGKTITGKATLESSVYLVFAFEDPLYDVGRICIGTIKAVAGTWTDKVTESPEIKEVIDTINEMREWGLKMALESDIPMYSDDCFWRAVSRAQEYDYLTKYGVKDILHRRLGNDRALIRETKKKYNL
ncbi:MAG: hypothetical protein E7283_02180 [Lachnospiraceae bacterium]|nr:hypothetical protein [Lachnospiraceae bacterium]